MERNNRLRAAKIFCVTILLFGMATSFQALSDELDQARKAFRMRDYQTAFRLYIKAAGTGNAEAQFQLSNFYNQGIGVKESPTAARQWLEKSAAQQYPPAQFTLGNEILKSDNDRANILIKAAADQQYSVAVRYLETIGSSKRQSTTSTDSDWEEQWFAAARKNDLKKTQVLFSKAKSIDALDSVGRSALSIAAEFGGFEIAQWLIANGADVNRIDKLGMSPAYTAIANKDSAFLKLLIKNKLQLTSALANGDTLLHFSIRLKNNDAAKQLIKSGSPINTTNKEGWTSLDLAEYNQLNDIQSLLVAKKAVHGKKWDVNKKGGDLNARIAESLSKEQIDSLTLEDAASIVTSGNVKVAERISSRLKIFAGETLKDGSTLLTLVSEGESDDMLKLLIKLGANVNKARADGLTPLHLAARQGNIKFIRILMAASANPVQKDRQNLDVVEFSLDNNQPAVALHIIRERSKKKFINTENSSRYVLYSAKNNNTDVATELFKLDKPKQIFDKSGRDALWFSALNDNSQLAKTLVQNSFSKDVVDKHKKTPLYVAAENGSLTTALVISSTTNINAPTNKGWTPLMIAAEKGYNDFLDWLIKQHVDIETRNNQGDTALIIAVKANKLASVKSLVAAGANTTRKNKLGLSAQEIAETQHPELLTVMKSNSRFKLF